MDPFDTFGLAPQFELDSKALQAKYRKLQQALHPDRHATAPASHRRMNLSRAVEVNEAYAVLKDELKRAEALLRHLGAEADAPEQADPEFLMEVMELREGLGDAKAAGDLDRVEKLASRVRGMQKDAREALSAAFSKISPGDDVGEARALVSRLRYFKRFLDEVAVIEEEALAQA